jgi:acetyl esterase
VKFDPYGSMEAVMALDPQAAAFLDQIKAMGGPQLHELPVPLAREAMKAMASFQAPGEPVAAVSNRTIPGPAGDIPVRIYTPAGELPFAVLVYFHGGGWAIGDLDTHDPVCRTLTNAAGCMVISVDYRLAPENKFPAAAEDCYAATAWVASNAASIGGDPALLSVGGDSAGGNLAAVVSQMARDRGGPSLAFQLLVYPVTDGACDTRSYTENAEGYLLTRDAMLWFWDHYARDAEDKLNAYASPLRAENVAGLPPALVVTAEYDPLRDEGEAYGERLRAAGVPVQVTRYDGMIHGFFGMTSIMDKAGAAMREASAALRAAFR